MLAVYRKTPNQTEWTRVDHNMLVSACQRFIPDNPVASIQHGLTLLLTGGEFVCDGYEYRLLPFASLKFEVITKEEYDAIPYRDPLTLYAIGHVVDVSQFHASTPEVI